MVASGRDQAILENISRITRVDPGHHFILKAFSPSFPLSPFLWSTSCAHDTPPDQDYIDSMEGATKSALLCADRILEDTPALSKAAKEQSAVAAA